MKPSDFYSTSGVHTSPATFQGYTTVPILSFLKGQPWDDLALCLVLAFDPPRIRVTNDLVTSDFSIDRVTVFVQEDNKTIHKIEQERSIPLIGQFNCGAGIGHELRRRGIKT